MQNSPDIRFPRLATGVKWALGLVAAAVISPVIFLAVKGLVGLAIAGVVGLVIVNGAPYLAMKLANWKLLAIKFEARRNPVETLQNQLIEKRAALKAFLASIADFSAEVKSFGDKVEQFKRDQPEQAHVFVEQHDGMKALLASRTQRYARADKELDDFELQIKRAGALWQMAQASHRMTRLAGKAADDVFDKIKRDTALDAVQTSLNRAFAELETSLLEESPQTAIPHMPSAGADIVDVKAKEVSR